MLSLNLVRFQTLIETLYLILENISLLGCNSLVIITFCTKDSFFLCMLVLSIRYYWYYYHCYCLFLYFEFCTFYTRLDFLSKIFLQPVTVPSLLRLFDRLYYILVERILHTYKYTERIFSIKYCVKEFIAFFLNKSFF